MDAVAEFLAGREHESRICLNAASAHFGDDHEDHPCTDGETCLMI